MAMKTSPISTAASQGRRKIWLVAGVAIAAAVWLTPFLVVRGQQPVSLGVFQVAICGVVLGVGRQGFDVLILRVLGASLGLPVGLLISELALHAVTCRGTQDCIQFWVLGFGLGGGLVAVLMALVAFPTTILWRRGFTGLGPELSRLFQRAAWQWVVLATGALVGLYVLIYLMGFPWPA
jgi:hypothetical protein